MKKALIREPVPPAFNTSVTPLVSFAPIFHPYMEPKNPFDTARVIRLKWKLKVIYNFMDFLNS